MRNPCLGVLTTLLFAAVPAAAQTAAPTFVPPTFHAPSLVAPRRLPVARKTPFRAAALPKKPGTAGGSWIRINSHLLGAVGESTWINLAQATNIRFYQTGKTPFAAIGTGGSSYVSTSDPSEIGRIKAYVLAHQTR